MTKTYAQITREIQALQASAERMRASEVKAVVAKINESIATYGLNADDLRFPGTSSASGKRSSPGRASSVRPAASSGDVKFSDGQGNVWGGRGPRPAWLRQAIAQGKSLEEFASSGAKQRTDAAQRNGTVKGPKATGKLPPLYGHAKTGQTWSGRGPKPAWLKQALKKRGASIEDFLISARQPDAADAPTSERSPVPATPKNSQKRGTAKAVKTATGRKSIAKKDATSAPATSPAKTRKSAAAPASSPVVARKAAAKKSTTSTAARKTGTGDKSPVQQSEPAARKSTRSNGVKAGADKSQARKPARPRQSVASSMAPTAVGDAASPASFTPAAAPLPAGGSVNPADPGTGSTT